MKKLILGLILISTNQIYSQSSSALNNFVAGRYLGWSNTNGVYLQQNWWLTVLSFFI
jgi:hypothetical protein